MSQSAPNGDTPNKPTLLSILNNVFFLIVLIAMAIGGIFIALNKL